MNHGAVDLKYGIPPVWGHRMLWNPKKKYCDWGQVFSNHRVIFYTFYHLFNFEWNSTGPAIFHVNPGFISSRLSAIHHQKSLLQKKSKNREVCLFGTIWLFNIAMENGPFMDDLPIKNGDFPITVPAIATPQPQYSTIQDIYSDGILAKIYCENLQMFPRVLERCFYLVYPMFKTNPTYDCWISYPIMQYYKYEIPIISLIIIYNYITSLVNHTTFSPTITLPPWNQRPRIGPRDGKDAARRRHKYFLRSQEKKYGFTLVGSMVRLYMVTFTINIPQMLAYIPYMGMLYIYIW